MIVRCPCCCPSATPCGICDQPSCEWSATAGTWTITAGQCATEEADARIDNLTTHPDDLATGRVECQVEVDNLGDTFCLYYGNRHRVEIVTGGDGCLRLYQDDELLWIQPLQTGNIIPTTVYMSPAFDGLSYAWLFPNSICVDNYPTAVPVQPPTGNSFAWGTKAVTGEVRFKCTRFYKSGNGASGVPPACSMNPSLAYALCQNFCDPFAQSAGYGAPPRTTLGCAWESTGSWTFDPGVDGVLCTGGTATPRQPFHPVGSIAALTSPQIPDVATTGVRFGLADMTNGTTVKISHNGIDLTYTHGTSVACVQYGDGSVWRRSCEPLPGVPAAPSFVTLYPYKDWIVFDGPYGTLVAPHTLVPGPPTITITGQARLYGFTWPYVRWDS